MKNGIDLRRLHQIFDAAVELPAGAPRAELIAGLCEGDEALAAEVEGLLEGGGDEEAFMSHPEVSPDDAEFLLAPELKEGTMIGSYRLLEQIGEGANAIVYMVEQSGPLRRRAALKVLKAGMDTREVIARFESERQALAMMEHPHIAKVFDAGATASGRPYFVMELVRGVAITAYCDLNRLDTRERLELFISVCSAISHAHLKGVIHRDIKPSNVLVTLHDGEPVPKVIDFGIAKATGPNLTERTFFTRFHQFIGTPAYMSPEQAEMSGLDIDTRSDVYSLGVLLYELLTGSTPFDGREILQAGLSELQRVIRNSDPETPSTRVSTLSAEGLTAVAKSRRIKPGDLSSDIAGDLDWIVMKALEKDRVRRYETVGELMRDVRRHLDNEPVEAGPPSRLYRFSKFLKRNRTMAVAVVLVSFSLMIALLIAGFGLIQARRDATAARREAEKSSMIIGLMDEMFQAASPDSKKGRDFRVTQLLEDFSNRTLDQLSSQPEVELTLRRTVGIAYDGLGETLRAEEHLSRALALTRQIHGPDSAESAELQARVAWLTHELGNDEGALRDLREALEIQRGHLGAGHSDTLRSLAYLAAIYRDAGQAQQARKMAEAVLAQATSDSFPDLPWVRQILAATYRDLGEEDKAEALAVEIVEEVRSVSDHQRPRTLGALLGVIKGQITQGRLKEAEEMIDLGTAAAKRTLGSNHRLTLLLRGSKADLARARGDRDAAVRIYRDLHQIQSKILGPEHADTVGTLVKIASTSLEQDQVELADEAARDALAAATKGHGDDHQLTFQSALSLADSLTRKGRYQSAESLLRSNYQLALTSQQPDSEILLEFIERFAALYQLLDRPDRAERFRREMLTRSHRRFGPDDPRTYLALEKLIDLLQTEQRFGEAQDLAADLVQRRGNLADWRRHGDFFRLRKLAGPALISYRQALAQASEQHGPEAETTLELRMSVAESYALLGQTQKSLTMIEQGLKAATMTLGMEHYLARRYQSALNSLRKTRRMAQHRADAGRAALEKVRKQKGDADPGTLEKWGEWVRQLQSREPAEARTELSALLRTCREVLGEKDPITLQARLVEALNAALRGAEGEADEKFHLLAADLRACLSPEDKTSKSILDQYANYLLRRGRRGEFDDYFDSWQDELSDAEWPEGETEELISRGSSWYFLNYETDEGDAWKEFGEETPLLASKLRWLVGRAPFGYGIVGEATSPLLIAGRHSHTTFYFRKAFEVDDPEGVAALKVRLRREDGAAVYLNGKEVVRSHLPPEAKFDTPAAAAWKMDRSVSYVHLVDPALLRPGTNIVAVEIHQSRPDSPDMVFDLQLTARRQAPIR